MTKYWLHVADYAGFSLEGEVLRFKERWKDTIDKVGVGDKIAIYLPKKSEFMGFATVVDGSSKVKDDREYPYQLKVQMKNYEPLSVKNVLQSLKFITNKKRWYVYFNKSLYGISRIDFDTILEGLERKKINTEEERRDLDVLKDRLNREILTRAPSGVRGLDDILQGGFPINSTVLVTGGPGAGKTILALQFLLHGVENGDHGVFISMDERPDDLRKEALKFGWDLTEYEKDGSLVIVDVSYPRSGLPSKEKYQISMPFTLDNIVRTVYEIISEIDGKRVVIDSLPAFGLHFEDEAEVRIAIHRLNNLLLSSGCTSVITSEIIPGKDGISRFGVEEFIARGIILVEIYREGKEYKRALTILKMRETEYDLRRFAMNIGKKGVEVLPHKVVFFDEAARIL